MWCHRGAWLPLILMLQSCKFLKVILEAQAIQICSIDILRLTIDDFLKFGSYVWSSMAYGNFFYKINHKVQDFHHSDLATKIDIKHWHLHSNRNNFRPHPCSHSIARVWDDGCWRMHGNLLLAATDHQRQAAHRQSIMLRSLQVRAMHKQHLSL